MTDKKNQASDERKEQGVFLPYPQPFYALPEDEIDLYELWLILKKRKKIILFTTILFLLVGLIYALTSPRIYKVEVTLMPLGGKGSRLSTIISSLPISLPVGGSAGITVEAVLKSRTLRERVVEKLGLVDILLKDAKVKSVHKAAEVLEDWFSVSTDRKTGVLTFSVEFPKDPELAYKIAITAIDEAQKILNEKSFSLAKKYRLYVEKQFDMMKKKYQELEKIYKDFVDGRIKRVPFVIGSKELESLALNLSKNESEAEKRVRELSRKLREKETFVSVSDYNLNLERLKTQMEVVRQLLATLAREYELAKAKETKESISFQVIDYPYVPEKPYKPKRRLIVMVSLVSGLFLGIFLAFFKEWLDNVRRSREEAEK